MYIYIYIGAGLKGSKKGGLVGWWGQLSVALRECWRTTYIYYNLGEQIKETGLLNSIAIERLKKK